MSIATLFIAAGLIASVQPGQAQSADGATPPQPIITGPWMSDDDYPPEALAKGEQGTVGFVLSVSAAGKVTDCRIAQTSGSPSLDAATCKVVARSMRFKPARDAKGKRVAGELKSRLNWKLPRAKAG